MNNKNISNKSIPLNLIIKLNIARIIIIWEGIAKYFYRVLLVMLLFSVLTLTEVFIYLNFWVHSALLIFFFVYQCCFAIIKGAL